MMRYLQLLIHNAGQSLLYAATNKPQQYTSADQASTLRSLQLRDSRLKTWTGPPSFHMLRSVK